MNRLLYQGTKKLPEILGEKEINRIIYSLLNSKDYPSAQLGKWMRIRDICLIATIYLLGLRPKEACCLRFDDFDFKGMILKIRGENNKMRKDRVLPVPRLLTRIYKPYLQFSRYKYWKGSKYLFPSMQQNHISPGRLKHIFREKALKPLGLWKMSGNWKLPKIRLYTLRHSRASHILQKQIKENSQPDLYAIANLLGHSDLRSTIVYLHTDKEYINYLRKQIEL